MFRNVLAVMVVASCGRSPAPLLGHDGGPGDAPAVPPGDVLALPDDALASDAPVVMDAPKYCPVLGPVQCNSPNAMSVCTIVGALPTFEICTAGCIDGSPPHCGTVHPSGNALVTNDLAADPTLGDIVIAAAATMNTDDGSITGVRPAGVGVISGIDFELRNSVGVFRVKSLRVDAAVSVVGTNALAIASRAKMDLNEVITARGACGGTGGGPGGFAGGAPGEPGAGPGGGGAGTGNATNAFGGGGGGDGDVGGAGGDYMAMPTPIPGGVSYGDSAISILRGGSGGGGGAAGGSGGGGGGAVQLVSNDEIRINPPQLGVFGGIDASACPGHHGPSGGGGGGGAGGAILVEAPTITLLSYSMLFVTGAGGGGSGPGSLDGGFDYLSRGGFGGSNGADGGDGGTRDFNGRTLAGSIGGGGFSWGGGGGGGVGRIRVNYIWQAVTNGAYIPQFTDATTTATLGTLSAD